jgi:hypothetical protein
MIRRLLPGLFRERSKGGVPINVNSNGTTSVSSHDARRAYMDPVREMVALEEGRAETWKARAQLAEAWHWKAAAALADCRRRFVLPDPLRAEVDKLLQWMPE